MTSQTDGCSTTAEPGTARGPRGSDVSTAGNAGVAAAREQWLVLRHKDGLWGVRARDVARLEHKGESVRIWLDGCRLEAEEAVGLCRVRCSRELGPVSQRFVPPGCLGLATTAHGPLMLIDAAAPPALLLEKREDGEQHDQDAD